MKLMRWDPFRELDTLSSRLNQKAENDKKFHRVERVYGKFVRRLAVPTDVDQQKVVAEFKNGVLNVHLPKSASAQSRAIDVKVA